MKLQRRRSLQGTAQKGLFISSVSGGRERRRNFRRKERRGRAAIIGRIFSSSFLLGCLGNAERKMMKEGKGNPLRLSISCCQENRSRKRRKKKKVFHVSFLIGPSNILFSDFLCILFLGGTFPLESPPFLPPSLTLNRIIQDWGEKGIKPFSILAPDEKKPFGPPCI